MSDDIPETTDTATTLCNWLIILTTVALIGAVVVVNMIAKDQYGVGWFK